MSWKFEAISGHWIVWVSFSNIALGGVFDARRFYLDVDTH
jgi:hypothetical protein